jgi:hypothetical protein
MGRSAKKVNVIEWEGNLEIHVYPAGSLKGLALKLDKKNKDKPVMVIGYRFDSDPSRQLIRRAILGIDLREGFKAYRDPSADGYDKIVISNNGLSSPLAAFRLEAEPKQLYPEGHPALAQPTDSNPGADAREKRMPASRSREAEEEVRAERRRQFEQQQAEADSESGTIKPFFREPRGGGTRH